jgi:hypothetical protein
MRRFIIEYLTDPGPRPGTVVLNANRAQALLQAHPLELTALIESVWREHRGPALPPPALPIAAWPQAMTDRILNEFQSGLPRGPLARLANTRWDHVIYAYMIEKTGIFDIFRKVSELYQSGEQLPAPGPESQRFWASANSLIFSSPPPMTVRNISGPHPDEEAQRMALYQRMLGLDLLDAAEIRQIHPYKPPVGSNVDFRANFEAFFRETWRGIANSRRVGAANDTNYVTIASRAKWIHNEMRARRRHENLLREEFRVVSVMSLLELAVSFDSSVVRDLNARADSRGERLSLIAKQVGIAAHPKSNALFEISVALSRLLQLIERGAFNEVRQAEMLCTSPQSRVYRDLVEDVIGLYGDAMDEDLTAPPVPGKVQQLAAPRLVAGAAASK